MKKEMIFAIILTAVLGVIVMVGAFVFAPEVMPVVIMAILSSVCFTMSGILIVKYTRTK